MNATVPTRTDRAPRRVVVAMSGGVDSSVVAALLKEQGHDVIGITLQLYDHGTATGRKGSCCAGQDIHDARRVAAALGIPHYVLDYERRFEDTVMRAFADSYLAGETPVPCVTCNREIKFSELLQATRDLGAEVLATGHYIRRDDTEQGPVLRRAADADRDQSYFLYATTREQLASLWFPLGGLTKPEVREMARRFAIATAAKPDSQDICFVPSGRYTDVIRRLRPDAHEPGEVVHVDGRVLGRHDGIAHFTVGQRKGLGITGPEALFVVRLDSAGRRVVVGPRAALETEWLVLRDVNWLGDTTLAGAARDGLDLAVRIRSSQPPRAAVLYSDGEAGTRVMLAGAEHGVAAGQACVFYDGTAADARVLGGGTIARTLSRSDEADGAAARMPQPLRAIGRSGD